MTQRVRFGLNADPNIGGVAIAERITAIADSHGLELVGMQDHPYNDGFLDTFTLLTWLASKTASVHFVTNVANLPLRPPVMLAKQAATTDVLSGGRFELGLGAGAFWEGIAGMGGPHRAPRTALESLSEAIDILRAFWAGEPFGFRGQHYQAPSVRPAPKPAHGIGIWLGVRGPRAVRLAGAKADGWMVSSPMVTPDLLAELNEILTEGAEETGRDPAAITRLYNVMGLITSENKDDFNGPVERWVDTLTSLYTESGMNAFIYWPSGDRERQSRMFAAEVVPAVRSALGQG
ncbi:MAG TPA: LLM class flavin-dependent oxidoreductase [Streptosporangiaceae bacterium]|jgi:alkanesulfonate monooxygenase SsuD/methylene tetrahydromethanopterin reductase-like flavin-dependent oxidoreductase (luciferase family)|nr:LLM class flavin-dependent oxidoreductase [Streptosporangiaceae bacterium]